MVVPFSFFDDPKQGIEGAQSTLKHEYYQPDVPLKPVVADTHGPNDQRKPPATAAAKTPSKGPARDTSVHLSPRKTQIEQQNHHT